MAICHEHNLRRRPAESRPFGIRVSLRSDDPFTLLVGGGWTTDHWFATEPERDAVFEDMAGRHVYSRRGDLPSVRFEKIARGPVG